MKFQPPLLNGSFEITRDIGRHEDWQVCGDNIFMMERWVDLRYHETRPNWALIAPIIAVVVLVTAAILLYRYWRRNNCYTVSFAGKVKYVRKGEMLHNALTQNGFETDWLVSQCHLLKQSGIEVVALYTDAALTVPLDRSMKVYGPLQIFPKTKKK